MSTAISRLRTTAALVRLGGLYLALGLLKRLVPIRVLARTLWGQSATPNRDRAATAIARIVRLRRLLGRTEGDCLEQSLVLYRELSRAGVSPVLVVGLERDESRTRGHAWVEVDGSPVMETVEGLTRFSRVTSFAERGAPAITTDG